jgi:signal transduction histidine kinase
MVLQTGPDLGEGQRRMLEEAEKSLGYMTMLVGQISELGRLEAGTATVVNQPADLFEMLATLAEDVHEAEDRGVQLRVRGVAQGACVHGDAHRLGAAFTALLKAVLREQPVETVVVADRRKIAGTTRAALVVIAREADLERAASAPTGAFDEWRGGLGLALPIARVVLERQGGRVWSPLAGDADPASRGAIVVSVPFEE